MADIPGKLAARMLRRWTMLGEHCLTPGCPTPLMENRAGGGEIECVNCGAFFERIDGNICAKASAQAASSSAQQREPDDARTVSSTGDDKDDDTAVESSSDDEEDDEEEMSRSNSADGGRRAAAAGGPSARRQRRTRAAGLDWDAHEQKLADVADVLLRNMSALADQLRLPKSAPAAEQQRALVALLGEYAGSYEVVARLARHN